MSTSGEEIKVLLTAEMAQLQAGMEAGAASVTKATEEMQATIAQEAAAFNVAVQSKVDSMVRLNAAFAGGITSTAGLAEAEAALDQAMAAGAVTAAENAGYLGRLDAAEIELSASTAAATAATDASTVAFTLNSRAAAEIGILMGELASGNASRMKRSFAALANQTGLLQKAVTLIFSPLGMLTVALGAVAFEVFEAGQKFEAMEGTVLATGEAAGYTAGQLIGMADEIGQSSGNISVATDAIRELAASGRFAGQDLRLVGQAATDMAQLTGQSIHSIVGQIEKLQEDPVKAVAKLNDQYHFLTVAQFEEIEAAQQSGDSMKAASIAYEAMADKMQGRTDELNTHVNVLIRGFRDMRQLWAESMQEMDHALGGGDDAFGLNEAKLLLATLEKQKKQAEEMGSSTLPGITLEIAAQQKKVDELTAKFHAQAQAAASVGAAAQKSAEQIDAMAKTAGKKPGAGHADHERAQADRDQYNEQRLQHEMSLKEEQKFWEEKKSAAKEGTQEYRQAVQQLLEIRSKQESASKSAARHEIEDARHVAEEQKRAIRDAETAEEEASKKSRALSLEKLKASHDEAIGDLANKRQDYELQFSEGQINAAQLLQLERDLVAQKFALDQQYYRDKEKLDIGDQVAITKDGEVIVKAMQQYHAQMTAAEKEFHSNSVKEWQGYARQIEGAMQGAINGMLFQHQTLRQGLANVALSIGEDFIKEAVMKPLDAWMSGEATKTAAALAGATQRQVIDSGAAAVSKATDAATGRSQITSAAATGAAKAYQAIVGIPYVGPVLAPIAAGVAFAGIEAFSGMISSAQGGWERVPIDGMMTELHKDEMVLPAHVANPIRDMAKNGSGQSGGDIHIHAVDAPGVQRLFMKHKGALVQAMKEAHRRGHFNR